MWRAARYGLEGQLVSPRTWRPAPAIEVVDELLEHVREGLEAHGDWDRVSEGVARPGGAGERGARSSAGRSAGGATAVRWWGRSSTARCPAAPARRVA